MTETKLSLDHPLYKNYEIRFNPLPVVWNKVLNRNVCGTTYENGNQTVSISIEKPVEYDLNRFIFEAYNNRMLNRQQTVIHTDGNNLNFDPLNLKESSLPIKQKRIINRNPIISKKEGSDLGIGNKTITEATKETGVKHSNIKECLLGNVPKAKGNNGDFYYFTQKNCKSNNILLIFLTSDDGS